MQKLVFRSNLSCLKGNANALRLVLSPTSELHSLLHWEFQLLGLHLYCPPAIARTREMLLDRRCVKDCFTWNGEPDSLSVCIF